MIKTLAIAALLAAPTTQTASRCITKQQVADAAMTLTPYLVEAVTEKCRAHLPAESFLTAKGADLHARLKSESAGREASAAQVLTTAMGGDVPAIKDSDSLVSVMGEMTSSLMAKDIPLESCAEISGMLEALAPLPAENIGLFVASAAALIDRGEQKDSKPKKSKGIDQFEICKNG